MKRQRRARKAIADAAKYDEVSHAAIILRARLGFANPIKDAREFLEKYEKVWPNQLDSVRSALLSLYLHKTLIAGSTMKRRSPSGSPQSKGGIARAKSLTSEQRSASAQKAAKARWNNKAVSEPVQ